MAQRDQKILAGKQVCLSEDDIRLGQYRRLGDDEKRIPIGLQFGALMRCARVLHREFMQAELLLHLPEQGIVRLVKADPYEHIGLLDDFADFIDWKRLEAHSLSIGNTIHDGGHMGITASSAGGSGRVMRYASVQ